jgi:hypothetical protein
MPDPDVLDAEGAADLLGVTADTVRRAAGRGDIPGLYLGVWRFSRRALLDAMTQRAQKRGAPKVLPRCQGAPKVSRNGAG